MNIVVLYEYVLNDRIRISVPHISNDIMAFIQKKQQRFRTNSGFIFNFYPQSFRVAPNLDPSNYKPILGYIEGLGAKIRVTEIQADPKVLLTIPKELSKAFRELTELVQKQNNPNRQNSRDATGNYLYSGALPTAEELGFLRFDYKI